MGQWRAPDGLSQDHLPKARQGRSHLQCGAACSNKQCTLFKTLQELRRTHGRLQHGAACNIRRSCGIGVELKAQRPVAIRRCNTAAALRQRQQQQILGVSNSNRCWLAASHSSSAKRQQPLGICNNSSRSWAASLTIAAHRDAKRQQACSSSSSGHRSGSSRSWAASAAAAASCRTCSNPTAQQGYM